MKLLYFLLAEDVLIDQRNQVTPLRLVERIMVSASGRRRDGSQGWQWLETSLNILICFHVEYATDDLKLPFQLIIETPRERLPAQDFVADFKRMTSARCFIELPGIPDHGEGDYTFLLEFLAEGKKESHAWTTQLSLYEAEDVDLEVETGSDAVAQQPRSLSSRRDDA